MTVPEIVPKDNSMAVEIKVLTLNIWGIPGVSKDRKARVEAIANQLITGPEEYDFVFLQEVWSLEDYRFIVSKVNKKLPFSEYFVSGGYGSGLCTFSKTQITDVRYRRFSLNGFPHKILHGDWWGGKGVALCRTVRHGIPFCLANTHLHGKYPSSNWSFLSHCLRPGSRDERRPILNNQLHACYDADKDEYVHHRAVQAFETPQFIRSNRRDEDVLIFAGDFNVTSTDFAYGLIKCYGNLVDTYTESPVKPHGSNGETCETPSNSYTAVKTLVENPSGNRIDYIFYQTAPGHKVKTKLCDQPWPQRVPAQEFSFSDHEAVRATLTITPVKDGDTDEVPLDAKYETESLLNSSAAFEEGLKKVNSNRKFYLTLCVLVSLLLIINIVVQASCSLASGVPFFLDLMLVLLSFILMYMIYMGFTFYHLEFNEVQRAKQGIECDLERLRIRNAQTFEEERKRALTGIK
ncbi:putative neutral sphingomyelinase isoform X1 [Macrobrachium nipponense]|uniref:putative neutral sphingomyelinase isoform X1 n=1 Tax=Macrobrachium nipponense TaxID=159736 RepID=UPI0030C82F38